MKSETSAQCIEEGSLNKNRLYFGKLDRKKLKMYSNLTKKVLYINKNCFNMLAGNLRYILVFQDLGTAISQKYMSKISLRKIPFCY